MAHKCLLCLYLLLFFLPIAYCQNFNTVWAKSIGWYNNEYSSEIAIDKQGNIWGVSYIDGSLDTINNMGLDDVYLFKSDSYGNILIEFSFGGSHKDRGFHLAIDEQNNCWVSGYFNDSLWVGQQVFESKGNSDAFLIKFSPDGQFLWGTNLGNTGFDQGKHIAIHDNTVYWAGNFQGSIIIGSDTLEGHTNSDNYLIKMDTLGNYIWAKQWGSPAIEDILGLNINSHGNILVSSLYRDIVYIGGDTLYGNTTGNTLLTQYDDKGDILWNYTFGGISSGIDQDGYDNIYLAGSYQDEININGTQLVPFQEFDAYVLSLDSSAQFRWLCPLQGYDLIMTNHLLWNESRKELYVSGVFQGTIFYGNDSLERSSFVPSHINNQIFVISLDEDGNAINDQKFDGEWVSNILVDNTSNALYMFGSYQSITEFDTITLYAFGGLELFLAKFNFHTVNIKPINIRLFENPVVFPSPINKESNLKFDMAYSSDITITAIDVNGQVVKEIHNGRLTKGRHIIPLQFDKEIFEGIYFIILQNDTQKDYIIFVKQ
ncbi:MAG: hypothetical protein MK207_07635 [Saprospiraceae bacterium]|nr:hypothetical protein [Saprospiraceae bacterium]